METIIEIKNVTKTFSGKDQNVEALKGINLEIHKGEMYEWRRQIHTGPLPEFP